MGLAGKFFVHRNGTPIQLRSHREVASHKTTTTFTYYTTGTAKSPGMVDDYTYAECVLGLTLRIDNLRAAIQQLGPYATI